jgi:hypothetical protein
MAGLKKPGLRRKSLAALEAMISQNILALARNARERAAHTARLKRLSVNY